MRPVAAFKDLFSGHAADYARFRPTYPPELFGWLAEVSPSWARAVDVGSGNGQAAVGLAAQFDHVVGIEPSPEQRQRATDHPKVEYRTGSADATGLEPASADLVLAAQSFHWFPREAFFDEVRRIARPGGVLALVTYALSTVSPEVDQLVAGFYRDLDPYWEPERRLVETGYATVEVPFDELETPQFAMTAAWTADQVLGFLGTWSALRRALTEGADPLADLSPRLRAAWGDAATRLVTWPLSVRAFRLPAVH